VRIARFEFLCHARVVRLATFSKPTNQPTNQRIDNEQRTTNNEQRVTNNEQRTTNNEQRTTNNEQRTTNNEQPTTNNEQRTTNELAMNYSNHP